jgi:hypothetical protein
MVAYLQPGEVEMQSARMVREKDKDGQKRSLWRCKYCVQHKNCYDDAVKCPGSQAAGYCIGGVNGESLHCIHCNSSTKCNCSMNKNKKQS